MNIGKAIWLFFAKYQTKSVRLIHLITLVLVLSQILTSNWMAGTKIPLQPSSVTATGWFFSWVHIISGICLFLLAIALIFHCFQQRGIRYFYPYLWGGFKPLIGDLQLLLRRKLPDSTPKGLAAIVQGLGLGALLIAVLSGLTWFVFWMISSPLANEIRNLHKTLVILIEIYFYGHGALGIIHFALWYKNNHGLAR